MLFAAVRTGLLTSCARTCAIALIIETASAEAPARIVLGISSQLAGLLLGATCGRTLLETCLSARMRAPSRLIDGGRPDAVTFPARATDSNGDGTPAHAGGIRR